MKHAKSDFTAEQLPHNRLQVFFDCIKIRFATIAGAGLMCLVFAVPLIALYVMKTIYLNDVAMQYADGLLEVNDAVRQSASIGNLFNLISVLGYAILGLGIGGVIRVIRQTVWGEGVFFKEDFAKGIKQNGLRCGAVAALLGATVFVCGLTYSSYGAYFDPNFRNGFAGILPACIAVALPLPVMILCVCQIAVYNAGLGEHIKNACILTFKSYPTTLLAVLCSCAPLSLLLIDNLIFLAVFTVLYFLFLLPMTLTAVLLYGFSVLDRYVNALSYPEIVDKGVYRNQPRG